MKAREVLPNAYHYAPVGAHLVLSARQFEQRIDLRKMLGGVGTRHPALRLIKKDGDDYHVEVLGKDAIGFKAGDTYRILDE